MVKIQTVSMKPQCCGHTGREMENDISVLSSYAGQSEPQQMPMNVVRFFLGSPESSEFTTHIPM